MACGTPNSALTLTLTLSVFCSRQHINLPNVSLTLTLTPTLTLTLKLIENSLQALTLARPCMQTRWQLCFRLRPSLMAAAAPEKVSHPNHGIRVRVKVRVKVRVRRSERSQC